ncbi:MAG: J domain-containing protein [Sphingomonas sp.]
MLSGADPYCVLGLSPGAEDVVVRAAYKALLRKYHPDLCHDPSATERTRAITEAFGVLGDLHRRAAFDRTRRGGDRPPPRTAAARAHATPRPRPPDRANRRLARRRAGRVGLTLLLLSLVVTATAFGARALLHRHPHVDAVLHEQFDTLIATLRPDGDTATPASIAATPAVVPEPNLVAIDRGGSDAIAVITAHGETEAIKASRACANGDTPDWQSADYCAAFDLGGSAALTAIGKASSYFGEAAAKAALRYERLGLVQPEGRIEQIRATVVPDTLARVEAIIENRILSRATPSGDAPTAPPRAGKSDAL